MSDESSTSRRVAPVDSPARRIDALRYRWPKNAHRVDPWGVLAHDVAVLAWLGIAASGVAVDYVLLPSVMLASMVSAVIAPYLTRVFPERLWQIVVPTYCLVVVGITFWKLWPELQVMFG